jgi:VanZ family protein
MEMLWRHFGDLVPAVAVGLPVAAVVAWGLAGWRSRRMESAPAWRRSVLDVLVVVTLSPVLYLVLMPAARWEQTRVRLAPGSDLLPIDDMASVWQLVGNLVMLLPLGLVAPLRWPWLRSMVRVAFAAVAVGVGIEAAQWAFDLGRAVTTDDALINAVGAVLSRPWWSARSRSRESAEATS